MILFINITSIGQAKSGKCALNTRKHSGEARLSGLCYFREFDGSDIPPFKFLAIVKNPTFPPPCDFLSG